MWSGDGGLTTALDGALLRLWGAQGKGLRSPAPEKTIITLLSYFTYALASGQTFVTEWMRIPDGYQNWQLVVAQYGKISTTTVTFQLQTCWDTASPQDIGTSILLGGLLGPDPQDISSGMGPMVRVRLVAGDDSVGTISVYLTPKSE